MAYTATTREEEKNGDLFGVAEVRTDANRAASREHWWGPASSTPTSQADPYFYIIVSDGNTRCRFGTQGKRPGLLTVDSSVRVNGGADFARRNILTEEKAGYLFGYITGLGDRIDVILRNASELRVRNQPERVNGVLCLVLEARRTYPDSDQQYTLWFDPAHGYNIARADTRIVPKGHEPDSFCFNQVTFRQVDGVWVPASADTDTEIHNPRDGWRLWSSRGHVRITNIRVNPKDNPVNAFGLNDVSEGSRVQLVGDAYHSGKATLQNGRVVDAAGNVMYTLGTWQKGRAVDAKGNVLWTPESLGGIATNKPPESGRTGGTDKLMPAGKE
jgi:hypothetical protein